MNRWSLPKSVIIGGIEYVIFSDFRDVLDIFEVLQDVNMPEQMRVRTALAVFYDGFSTMPQKDWQEAITWMFRFLNGGEEDVDSGKIPPKRIDWQQDQPLIVADINRVSGCEVRALSYLHWWTFLSWFQSIGEGQLSAVVGIREKKRKGQKLEKWEQEFYSEHKGQIEFKKRYSVEELAERERLLRLLGE